MEDINVSSSERIGQLTDFAKHKIRDTVNTRSEEHIPMLYQKHLAWQNVIFNRKNSLVLDPFRTNDSYQGMSHYFWFGADTVKDLTFYRNCGDVIEGQPSKYPREPLPDLDHVLYVDYKLFFLSMDCKKQREILDTWLFGTAPIKLLHVSVDQYDCMNSLELLELVAKDLRWSTNLSIQIIDRSVHRQNADYVKGIVRLFQAVIPRCLTIELHSSPSNNLGGLTLLYDLKRPDHELARYTVFNSYYLHYLDGLKAGRITNDIIF